ncbi:hypothetical protein [Desulfobulbus propionicus]|jgi:hypothetical protein
MKKISSGLVVAFLLSLIGGCAGSTALWTDEKEMESARHWDILANDLANRINNELVRKKMFSTSVHVRHSCGTPNSCGPGQTYPFDEGFHDLLISQLVNFGVHTTDSPEHADLFIDYKVQVIHNKGQYEIIITTSIAQANQYLVRFSDIYTIPNSDFWQYRKISPAPQIRLTGPAAPPPAAHPQKTTPL